MRDANAPVYTCVKPTHRVLLADLGPPVRVHINRPIRRHTLLVFQVVHTFGASSPPANEWRWVAENAAGRRRTIIARALICDRRSRIACHSLTSLTTRQQLLLLLLQRLRQIASSFARRFDCFMDPDAPSDDRQNFTNRQHLGSGLFIFNHALVTTVIRLRFEFAQDL